MLMLSWVTQLKSVDNQEVLENEGFIEILCWLYCTSSMFFSNAFSKQVLHSGVMQLGLYDTHQGQVSLCLFMSKTSRREQGRSRVLQHAQIASFQARKRWHIGISIFGHLSELTGLEAFRVT